MLKTVQEVTTDIQNEKVLLLAGEEELLARLPPGPWIGGTIPYFMTSRGGVVSKDKIFVQEIPGIAELEGITIYSTEELENIPTEAAENGFSIIIIPASSKAHIHFAENAPKFADLFLKPLIGWISGVHLDDLGKKSPKVFDGYNNIISDENAVVMHLSLTKDKIAQIGIVNLFEQGNGDSIHFEKSGFQASKANINGKNIDFTDYIRKNNIDTRLPLVADYNGAMINVSFQKATGKIVNFYAPVFSQIEYKLAKPVQNYGNSFARAVTGKTEGAIFSCNCILNFLYSELEGKKNGDIPGPITFGEIAYQLLNQTLVYLNILSV